MEDEEEGQTIWKRRPVGESRKAVSTNNAVNLLSSFCEDLRIVHHCQKEVTDSSNSLNNIHIISVKLSKTLVKANIRYQRFRNKWCSQPTLSRIQILDRKTHV